MPKMKNLDRESEFDLLFETEDLLLELKKEEEKPKETKRSVKVAELSKIQKCPLCGRMKAIREDVCYDCLNLPLTEVDF